MYQLPTHPVGYRDGAATGINDQGQRAREEEEEDGTTHSRPAPFTRYVPSHHVR